jgi:hypothetical protein
MANGELSRFHLHQKNLIELLPGTVLHLPHLYAVAYFRNGGELERYV